MSYDFDKVVSRDNTQSVKWNYVKQKTGVADALPLWVADMDFETVPEIRTAIIERAKHLLYGYTARSDSYYQAITDWFSSRHSWTIDRSWITHSTGVVNALYTVVRAYVKEGDGVLIQPPVYHPFYQAIKRAGAKVIKNPLHVVKGRYELDLDDFETKLKVDKPKLFILCNPHNPVGRVFSTEELSALGKLCLKYGVIVVSDEIHGDIICKGQRHVPFASISADFAKHSIICTAPSKTFNLAGLSTSNIIIPDQDLRAKFDAAADQVAIKSFNIFGAVACEAAYRYGAAWLDELLVYLEANIVHTREFIEENLPQLQAFKTEGTYFVWLDCRALGLGNVDLERFLLEKARLWLNQGHIFGPEGDGFVRINVACPRVILDEALERFKKAVQAIGVK